MEPEIRDAVDIKQEFSSITIKEEHGTDDIERTNVLCDASTIVVKSEQSNAVAVKQEYNYECSDGDSEEREVKSEQDPLSIVTETQTEVVDGTCSLLNASGYTSEFPIHQHDLISVSEISETNADISQHSDVDLCSYSCDFSNKKFNKLFQLQKHTVIHEDEKCAKLFTQSERRNVQVQRNDRSKQIDRQHVCSICNKLFSGSGVLNRHVRTHSGERPFLCETCNKSFTRGEDLKRHLRFHTGERPFCCEICKKSFTQRGNFKRHMRTHVGKRPFCCKHKQSAEFGTESRRSNVQVQRSNRSKQIDRRHICSICNKSFSGSGVLNRHVRTHSGERPFRCEICNKSFTCGGDLNRHIRFHTGERPFCCKICNKCFTRHDSLKSHTKTHTGESLFCCEICNKTFTQKGSLKTHMRSHRDQ